MTDANRNQDIDYNIDREEIAMEEQLNPFTVPLADTDRSVKQEYLDQISFYAEDIPFSVSDIPSPDGLEDAGEPPFAMGPGMEEEGSLEDFMNMLRQALTPREPASMAVKALESLLPIIDAGVDAMAMEGYVKTPDELRTVEGQLRIRSELVDGVIAAFHVFGIDMEDVRRAMMNVEQMGMRFKQEPEDIADRLTVWDEISIVNHLYGPKLAGRLMAVNFNRDEKDPEGNNG